MKVLGGLPLRTEIELGGGEACHDGALAGARIAARLARLVLLAEGVSSEELFFVRESPHVADRLARGRAGLATAVAIVLQRSPDHSGDLFALAVTSSLGGRLEPEPLVADCPLRGLGTFSPHRVHGLDEGCCVHPHSSHVADSVLGHGVVCHEDPLMVSRGGRKSFTPLEPSPSERSAGFDRADGIVDAGKHLMVAHGDPFRGFAPFFVSYQPLATSYEFEEADLWWLIAKGFVKARLWIFRTDYYNIKNPFCQGC